MPDEKTTLDRERIKSLLPDSCRDMEILVFDTIGSTNTEAKRLVSDGAKRNMLICAEEQTAGRGRHGKSFYSPEKTGIYMSIVIHRELPLNLAAGATTAAAVAVCEAIEKLTEKRPKIKWVNDIFLDNKKICGILTEAVSGDDKSVADSLVIGIGINISTVDFPDDLKQTAGSLNEENIDKNVLVSKITEKVIAYTKDLENPTHIEKYKERCFVLGRKITYFKNGETLSATAVDIDENAGLVIKNETGETLTLNSGEISIKI